MSIATLVSILISFNALSMDDAKQAPKVEKDNIDCELAGASLDRGYVDQGRGSESP